MLKKLLDLKGHGGYSSCHVCFSYGEVEPGKKICHYQNKKIYQFINDKGIGTERTPAVMKKIYKKFEEEEKKSAVTHFFGVKEYSILNYYFRRNMLCISI